MYTNSAAGSSTPGSHGWYQPQQGSNGSADAVYTFTPEECLTMYQRTNDLYWHDHGLTMNHSGLPSSPRAHTPYWILPQQEYIAKRSYQPQAPILFRAGPTVGYVRLTDFYSSHTPGSAPPLEGGDDVMFSGDNVSQKQSIRLEIDGCKPYERQINVRNPANNSRSITRRKLAEKVAKEIHDFMSRQQQTLGAPSWGIGPGSTGFERLVLIELRHVSRSSWQPILGVLH